MQVRGEGERVKSLKVSGEEICRMSIQSNTPRFQSSNYLIWCIAYAYVEIWQLGLYHVAKQDFQSFRFRLALYALCDFACHSWIKLNSYDLFGLFEDFDRDIASTRTDFEDYLSDFSRCGMPRPLQKRTSLCLRSALSTMA